jgi:Domain of unknown function (DUF4303)
MPRPIALDWNTLERVLLRLTEADIHRFARGHTHETYYGFAFDCNSKYGEIGLCLNTNKALRAQRNAPDPNAAFWAALDKKLKFGEMPNSPGKASNALRRKRPNLRWSLGDWEHQAFNSPEFDRGWRRFQSRVLERCMMEEEDKDTFMTPTQARFMEAVCRVLVRLERKGAFEALNRTRDFTTLAIDHDESEADGRARLKAVRRRENSA